MENIEIEEVLIKKKIEILLQTILAIKSIRDNLQIDLETLKQLREYYNNIPDLDNLDEEKSQELPVKKLVLKKQFAGKWYEVF